MARHYIPSFTSLWQRHEALYIAIFMLALQRLAENKCDAINENSISEYLCPILTTVCFEQSKKNNYEIRTPDWEKPTQPVTVSELRGGKIRKRPDFTCKCTNPFAVKPSEHEIPFHIECKCLGSPTSTRWILNKNYVINGIKRFDSRKHGYGKRASSGMMVGYVISMSPEQILDEVNIHQKKHCSYYPDIKSKFVENKVRQYSQNLNRKNLKPKIFKLFHLWVDLKGQ